MLKFGGGERTADVPAWKSGRVRVSRSVDYHGEYRSIGSCISLFLGFVVDGE